MYFCIKTPFIVSNRDFVVRRNIYQNYNGYDYLMYMNSEVSPLKGHRPSYVRGKIMHSCQLMRKIDDETTEISIILTSNPNGLIPKYVVKKFSNSLAIDFTRKVLRGYPILFPNGKIE